MTDHSLPTHSLLLQTSPTPVAFFGPYLGPLDFEISVWQVYCRHFSCQFTKSYVCSFRGMDALYNDFAVCMPHAESKRDPINWFLKIDPGSLLVPSDVTEIFYPIDRSHWPFHASLLPPCSALFDYRQFGNSNHSRPHSTVLFHTSPLTSFRTWLEITQDIPNSASIGDFNDLYVPGPVDLRNCDLSVLMDYIASSKLVVAPATSPYAYLASHCGTPSLIWGNRKYHLANRHKVDYNPFQVSVSYLPASYSWEPNPTNVRARIEQLVGTP